jgi:opacity protein-like surface antigen
MAQWSLVPAAELEGYYFGKRTFSGDLINNTVRLPEHDFVVTYPMRRSVFLANAVLNLGNPCILFHPYVGVGFGGAIVKISGADALQIDPPELNVNHYNSNSSDLASTFAGQIKAGFSYDINNCVSLFAEYRYLYLSSTQFAFGSTVYPGHFETTNWNVKVKSQHYNLGDIGIRINL